MERLLLVRHGQTAWNAQKILQGQSDVALSPLGTEQALALAPLVRRFAPQWAVCSDLSRAVQTAELIGWPRAGRDARWREADLGDWTGCSAQALIDQDPPRYQRWRDGIEAPPGGETMAQFRRRVAQAIQSLAACDGSVLVVTHGGVIRAALAVLLGLGAERIVAVEPGSLTALQMGSGGPRLLAFNHTSTVLATELTD